MGGRRFWIYRSLLDDAAAHHAPAMARATRDALELEFDGSALAPIGLCLLLSREERRRWPLAETRDPPTIHAGYLDQGLEVRISYFARAEISLPPGSDVARFPQPDVLPPAGYRIDLFAQQDAIAAADVLDFWQREGALRSPVETRRRLSEVLLIATDQAGRIAGVATTYLQANPQLRAQMWYARVFVAAAHRRTHLALALAVAARDHLAERFASGEDRRGIGLLFEVESEVLKRAGPHAVWPVIGSTFIGETSGRSHVRVDYFPGAPTPEPD